MSQFGTKSGRLVKIGTIMRPDSRVKLKLFRDEGLNFWTVPKNSGRLVTLN